MDVVITLIVPTILYVESFSEQILYFPLQVYLVTGGWDFLSIDKNNAITYLDSTEVLIKDAISWKVITQYTLPQPMARIGGISFQNKIFMIGIREAF